MSVVELPTPSDETPSPTERPADAGTVDVAAAEEMEAAAAAEAEAMEAMEAMDAAVDAADSAEA